MYIHVTEAHSFFFLLWNPTGFQEPSRDVSQVWETTPLGFFDPSLSLKCIPQTFWRYHLSAVLLLGSFRTGWFPATLLGAAGTLGSSRMCQSLQGTGVVSLCCRGWDLAIRPPKQFCWCSEPLSSDKCQFLFSHQGSDHRDIDQYCYSGLKAHENLTKTIIDLWIFLPCVQGLEDPAILLEMAEGTQRGRCAMRQLLKSRFSDSYAVTPINQALQVVCLVMLCKPHVVEGKDWVHAKWATAKIMTSWTK